MILSNLFASLMQLIFKPKIWIPLLGTLIISTAVTLGMSFLLQGLILDITLYSNITDAQPIFSVIITQYLFEIIIAIVLAFFMTVIGVISFMSTSRISQGEKLVKAINTSVNEYRKAVGIAIIFWGTFIFAFFLGIIISIISGIQELVAMVLMLFLIIIAIVVLIKTIFTIPALNKNEVREAFKLSWKFTQKKFWNTFFYLILLILIILVAGSIFYQIELIIMGTIIDLPLLALFETFPSLLTIISITNYFYSKQ